MRALKILVVVMGVLLVGGTAALIAAIIDRSGRHRADAGAARGFDRTTLALPEGARVLGTDSVGDRLVLRLGLANGDEALILLDPRSGARLGTIELKHGAAGEGSR